ncbi:C2 calcium-dependent membrane targeting [Macleaya cordata]|uniref:C2 calcium-dependent membrane targeting n=1 Tax=Macleaya cordata TaxID=56857 RepID=A0A200QF05_MACCD|nr:C2 calcium-dependent membrane targeting [Macleaya cordata]
MTTTTIPTTQTTTVRKLIVDVVDARDLLPKDGQGSSSPYVVADFDGQRKRTSTVYRDLNPVWNEQLEFVVSDPKTMEFEELEIEVYNDKRMGGGGGSSRKNHFLGRVKIYGSQFWKRGDEGLIYFPLEKKSVFSWIRGEIGLRIYYFDEEIGEQKPDEIQQPEKEPESPTEIKRQDGGYVEERSPLEIPEPTETAQEAAESPPVVIIEESPPQIHVQQDQQLPEDNFTCRQSETQFQPEVRKMQTAGTTERIRVIRRPNGDYAPKIISGRFSGDTERASAYDLVEPMQYLFVRIVKARGLSANEIPYVKIRTGSHFVRSKPAFSRPGEASGTPEWHQVFALSQNRPESGHATLEISVWDGQTDHFLGGVCFDLSDVPVRDPPDSPLAPQWYRLEGGDDPHINNVSGDIQLSVWMGTQADDAFPESLSSDAPYVSYTRAKVYQSPKLWYLRVTVIEAQDLQINSNSSHPSPSTITPDIRVKAHLGFQYVRTKRGVINNHSSSFFWNEDLIFVAGEPLEEHLILSVEDRSCKDPLLLGHAAVQLNSIEQRLDERHVASKWFALRVDGGSGDGGGGGNGGGIYSGRLHLRLCLEGGYHVLDEAAHVCSDFRPTAKQLWKPALGVLEIGILGARGLLPMKTRGGGKGSTDAYCVAKYGNRWVRTKTIMDSFDPRWNEQYAWQVFDPCTVFTIGVFDNWRMFADVVEKPDCRIGKIRIRVSSLESNKVYTSSYPLLVLLRSGLKKMGEIELGIRFRCSYLLPETCSVYGQPMLPRMHYLRPIGLGQQEALRSAATKMVAAWVGRAEPPLGPEVVRYMLDADSHTWSMRKSKANWFRILAVLSWAIGFWRWVDEIRRWRNPVTTVLVHVLYLVLVWYPELIVPTGSLYLFLIGVWYYRFRPKIPAGMDIRLSQADRIDPDELEEELDTIPSSSPGDVIRMRYDRLRTLAGRIQTVLGDFATQGERLQALLSWRDPRATRLFIGVCLVVAATLYVVPPKMVAVALGFYFLRHPMFRDPMPPASLNFFRRLPSLSDRLI